VLLLLCDHMVVGENKGGWEIDRRWGDHLRQIKEFFGDEVDRVDVIFHADSHRVLLLIDTKHYGRIIRVVPDVVVSDISIGRSTFKMTKIFIDSFWHLRMRFEAVARGGYD
jgi:hypothetical protein